LGYFFILTYLNKCQGNKNFEGDGIVTCRLNRMEIRSSEGSTAYLVLRLSTEPFNDVVEEPIEQDVKQAWDMNGHVHVDRPKAFQAQVLFECGLDHIFCLVLTCCLCQCFFHVGWYAK